MSLAIRIALVTLALGYAPLALAQPLPRLEILPPKMDLFGKEARQTVVAQWAIAAGMNGQAREAKLSSSNERVFIVKDGIVLPMGNGQATLTVKQEGYEALAAVT